MRILRRSVEKIIGFAGTDFGCHGQGSQRSKELISHCTNGYSTIILSLTEKLLKITTCIVNAVQIASSSDLQSLTYSYVVIQLARTFQEACQSYGFKSLKVDFSHIICSIDVRCLI